MARSSSLRKTSVGFAAITICTMLSILCSLYSTDRLLEELMPISYESEKSDKHSTPAAANSKKLGDGCHHVFIDAGANIGVHGRFLLEPDKYPDATLAHEVFGKQFGRASGALPLALLKGEDERDNRDLCVFAFEPNPAHAPRHLELAAAYANVGWRYHPILAGLGNQDGTLTFYHNDDAKDQEFGFGLNKLAGDKSTAVQVPIVKLSAWLDTHIHERKSPPRVYGTYPRGRGPRVVMKMDIEGSEYQVLPDLMFSGTLCRTVDYLFGEFHDWTPVDFSTDRGSLTLKPRKETAAFAAHLLDAFHAVGSDSCRTERFDLVDDESYLHDGLPLPTATATATPTLVPLPRHSNIRVGNKDGATADTDTATALKNHHHMNESAIICAIVKDEEKYLEEWTRYHIGLGFSDIYIYDNAPNRTAMEWLSQMDDLELMSRVHIHDYGSHQNNDRQLKAYVDCVATYARPQNHTWVAFYDPDEFLVLKQHETVVDFLHDTCPNGSVSVNWVKFGTANHTLFDAAANQPVTERFLYHEGKLKLETVKTIVRVDDFVRFRSPHWAYLRDDQTRRDANGNYHKGKWIAGVHNPTFLDNGPTDVAALHHYYYKSAQEYRSKFCDRGDVWDNDFCAKTNFDDLPPGHIYDDWAWRLLQKNVPQYRTVPVPPA